MFSVKVGTTNLDGKGSAENLTDSDIALRAPSYVKGEDFTAYANNSTVVASADYWNAPKAKELQVNAENVNVVATDFVDIDVNLETSTEGVNVDITNSKRGSIDTGSGDDYVSVTVQTNNAGWSNQFDVNTGDGNDTILFKNGSNSEHTKLNVDAGEGDDIIDVSGLNANLIDASERVLDGGRGDDMIIGSDGHETIFGGSGYDIIAAGGGNDVIDGGSGADIIYAGAGNDTVVFDNLDTVVDGGDGFDAIILSGEFSGHQNLTEIQNFEAVIGQEGTADKIYMNLQDGLIISLGGDEGDDVNFAYFDEANLSESDAELTAEQLEFIEANNIDIESLHAYEADTGEVIWTDVDFLA